MLKKGKCHILPFYNMRDNKRQSDCIRNIIRTLLTTTRNIL